jgi:prepilin-type N-terminal cleavage/methylation domain-containing protein
MNKKGFTLIELLAIIIILAIIAVITVPMVLDTVEKSKRNTSIDSAYGYVDSVNKFYFSSSLNDDEFNIEDGIYDVSQLKTMGVSISGSEPADGWCQLVNGDVVSYSLKFGDYVITKYENMDIIVEKNGNIKFDYETEMEHQRQAAAIATAKALATSQSGTTEVVEITEGWVAFINGELKAYSLKVTEGDYTYVVTDLDVDSNNSHAVADRTISDVASTTQAEQLIINYYSNQVVTEVSTYISSLSTETQGFTKDVGKKVSELTTTVPTGMDNNSWIYYEYSSTSITDYSIKMTKGGYSFVVNKVSGGTVSDPIYNGTITSPQKKPASFADDSWADIVANLTANRNAYPIGSTKIIHFDRDNNGTDEYYKLRLVNTEPCGDYTGSRTSCGVVIEFVTLIGTHNMNSSNTNAGGWYSSAMRGYLNTDTGNIFSKLPSDLRNVIIGTAPIVSGSGSGGVSNDVVATTGFDGDKLYLLSGKEVGSNLEYDNKKEDSDTKTLKYYTDNTGSSPRIKYSTTTSEGVDSTASWYLLRSAISYNTNYFCYVNNRGGDSPADANVAGGVAPAFRILD